MVDLVEVYGIIPFSEVKRFRELESRYREGALQVEGQLYKLVNELRDRMLGPFRDWIAGSNTMRADGVSDDLVNYPLLEIHAMLESAETLDELIVAVDQTLHAQHKRGIFISEISDIDSYRKLNEITRMGGFRNPGHIDLSERWKRGD